MALPSIEFSSKEKTDTLALGWFQQKVETPKGKGKAKDKVAPSAPQFFGKAHADVEGIAKRLKADAHFQGKPREVVLLRYYPAAGFSHVVLFGLGLAEKWSSELARQAGAALYLLQRQERLAKISCDAQSFLAKCDKAQAPRFLQAFCEGYLLAGYEYADLRTQRPESFQPTLLNLLNVDKSTELSAAAGKARVLVEAINFSRSLGDRPGNYATPALIANLIQKETKGTKIKCTIFDRARIQREKMGLLMGVGQGSAEDPRFIILEYKGAGASVAPIALVGKGISFDTGGISLKPSAKMEEMKYDMMGAATVAGVMLAAARMGLPINLTGYIAAAENMPGSKAQKPGDVMTSMNGKTVEITNTDAEGRLVLADALEYAQKSKPQCIIDYATLTGAVVIALGSAATGVMGNHPELMSRIKESSLATDERVWELPLFDEYGEFLKSSVADIKNSSDARDAGSSKAGWFLQFFVDPEVPWVHCDIAGSGMLRQDKNYFPRGFASGVMIRLTTHLLESWKKLGSVR